MEDLIFNRSFREWALRQDLGEADEWKKWITDNPQHAQTVRQAIAVIRAMKANLHVLPEDIIDREVEETHYLLEQTGEPSDDVHPGKPLLFRHTVKALLIAASLVIIAGAWLLLRHTIRPQQSHLTYETFLTHARQAGSERRNTSDTTQSYQLPDGSYISLEPNSKFSYVADHSSTRREVYLSGEAFFVIQKDPARTFIVYTNNIVTKVLGTSFRIRAYATDKKATVYVRTGKVSVFRADKFNNEGTPAPRHGTIVVTPNQEAVYTLETNEFSKSISVNPTIVSGLTSNVFNFSETPVSQVFKTMQDTYNIPILYDEEVLSGCSLSAKMEGASFYGKLEMICRAINASYEEMDGQIVILSKGCK